MDSRPQQPMGHPGTRQAFAHRSALSLLLASTLLAGNARAGQAHCLIRQNGAVAYAGRCQFRAEPSGSFTIRHPDHTTILPGITDLSLTLLPAGLAEVRGLTTAAINSRWGTARRSRADPACWTGVDFEICAW